MRVLAILSLFFAASTACGSECICQKPNGDWLCVAHVWGFNQHDCTGYCRDRACAGFHRNKHGEHQTCRIWKGFCEPDAVDKYMSHKHPTINLEYCDENHNFKYNSCPEDYNCPHRFDSDS